MRTVFLNNPRTELIPFALEDGKRLCLLVWAQTGVLEAPFRELSPAVQAHGGRPHHDLVEFEAYR